MHERPRSLWCWVNTCSISGWVEASNWVLHLQVHRGVNNSSEVRQLKELLSGTCRLGCMWIPLSRKSHLLTSMPSCSCCPWGQAEHICEEIVEYYTCWRSHCESDWGKGFQECLTSTKVERRVGPETLEWSSCGDWQWKGESDRWSWPAESCLC